MHNTTDKPVMVFEVCTAVTLYRCVCLDFTHICIFVVFVVQLFQLCTLVIIVIVKGIICKSSGFLCYETMLTWTLVLSLKFEFFLYYI